MKRFISEISAPIVKQFNASKKVCESKPIIYFNLIKKINLESVCVVEHDFSEKTRFVRYTGLCVLFKLDSFKVSISNARICTGLHTIK